MPIIRLKNHTCQVFFSSKRKEDIVYQNNQLREQVDRFLNPLSIEIDRQLSYYKQNGGKRRKTRRRTLNKRK